MLFRLIPFKSIDELNTTLNPCSLYSSVFQNNDLLIQDTTDMKVEKFSQSELVSLNKLGFDFNGFYFEADQSEYLRAIFNKDKLGVSDERFLYGAISVKSYSFFNSKYDIYFPEYKENDILEGFGCNLSYVGSSLSIDLVAADNGSDSSILMFVNGKPLYRLNSGVVGYDEEDVFRVMQFCKSYNGFEIVFWYNEAYFGVSLDNFLKPIKFHNLDVYGCSEVPKDFIHNIAKFRLSVKY